MQKAKVAVLVSGGGTNLQALIDYTKNNNANFEISLVISNKEDAYALKRAKNSNIETEIVLRNEFNDSIEFENRIKQILKENEIDLIVLAGFMSILTENFTSEYPNKIINVHPSLIPSFCGKGFYGLKVHEAALEYGVKLTGATVHFVNEIPDGGKIIKQKAVQIEENDTPETLQKRVMEQAEWIILPEAVNEVAEEFIK
ncbi:MAG: phosphoribosylglycinamide formyltransferase [Clostridiales bacterium]|nr:phosphoribosylglycinamide formyltransferase [Clostridiales bacterium]